ncbi:exonuclease SbcCD subunit D C-terminal domain-containing protein [Sandaracinus amylolyticus]|uniref:exonuclease SbcCD subunit D C-terminal domain-containing protein n=1 Tax=Sandaracinus amylolyticus TaxID=927083 RepID=UPI001F2537E0|nr:exonuclease SbcCD subunit D C-terminal domain-containing protein [Sandaracinus amylolyticus]UJR79139.1 Exodeoxyribonuclease I subunit D [Sandaracinus amylolyticus]
MPRPFTLCHTADWHLGHALHGRSREAEHAAFSAWLVDLLEAQRVDALVIAGDVFDSASPSGAAQGQLFEFLAALRARCPAIDVVIVAGNHDSPSRLAAPDPVLRSLRVRMVGAVPWVGRGRDQRIDPEPLVVPLHAEGAIAAWALAVPYLRACDLPALDPEASDEEPAVRIARGARRVYEEVAAHARTLRRDDQALIVTGHCHVAGAAVSDGSERPVIGGVAGALPVSVFPEDATYVALGHLHLAQEVEAQEVSGAHVRYSGSPIPLALGEESYPHEVRLVTFEGGRIATQAGHRVPRSVPILRVPRSGPAPIDETLAALRALAEDEVVRAAASGPETRWPWVEARVRLERAEPALRARVDEALAGLPVRLVKLTVEQARTGSSPGTEEGASLRELAELDVREVFLRRWALEQEGDPPDDVLAAFDEARAAVLGSDGARGTESGP